MIFKLIFYCLFSHIGRRHVQVRLVCPSYKSLNSGDCFILINSSYVFAWFGYLANIIESNKARELASWIVKHRELGFRGLGLTEDSDLDFIPVHESRPDESGTRLFWEVLGFDEPQPINGMFLWFEVMQIIYN